jgi:hypothetical protein
MIEKISQSELEAVEKFSAEEAQSAGETFSNLCFFLETLLKVFPDNEFGKLNSFYSIPSIRDYLNNINPKWEYCDAIDISQGEVVDLLFTLDVPENFMVEGAREVINEVVHMGATYFASINLKINLSGKINFRFQEDGDFASLKSPESLYYEMYFKNLVPVIEGIDLSANSFLECKVAGKSTYSNGSRYTHSFIKGTLTLSDALLVMKAIHTTGFAIGSLPKVEINS